MTTEVDAGTRGKLAGYSLGPASGFELVDPISGRQKSLHPLSATSAPSSSSSSSIETMSESLLVAPAGGRKTAHQNQQVNSRPPLTEDPLLVDTFNESPGFGTTLSRLREPNNIASRNNAIVLAPSSNAPEMSSSFLDRLSSIELLFLISSLMFIVLMALGLTASYYCFRRRRRLQRQQTASSMLRAVHRKHAYAGPNLPAHHHRVIRQVQPTQQSQYFGGGANEIRAPMTGSSSGRHAHYTAATQPLSSASSPDSDLSGRGHLLHGQYARRNQALDFGAGLRLSKPKPEATTYATPVGGRRNEATTNTIERPSVIGRANQQLRRHLAPTISGKRPRQQPNISQWRLLPPTTIAAKNGAQSAQRCQVYQVPSASFARTRSFVDVNESCKAFDNPDQRGLFEGEPNYRSLSRQHEHKLRQQRAQIQKQQPYLVKSTAGQEASSDDEDDNNNRPSATGGGDTQSNRKAPRLVLKSIDDAYITNITEIVEQEYMERDSTRPLGWSEWRRAASEAARKRHKCKGEEETSRSMTDTSSDELDLGPSNDNNRTDTLASAAGAMRSLTEVDVDFTRSTLLRNASGSTSGRAPVARNESDDDDDELDLMISPEYDCGGGDTDGNRIGSAERTIAQPVTTGTGIVSIEVSNNKSKDNQQNISQANESNATRNRLELVASPGSQDSVSYV